MYRINTCGYNISNPDRDVISRPRGSGDALFLLLHTPMEILQPPCGAAQPGACLLYLPGMPQHYRAVKEFRNSYVHFTLPEGAPPFGLPAGAPFYPANPDELNAILKLLYAEYLTRELHYEEKADALLRLLLVSAARGIEQSQRGREDLPLYLQFRKARLEILSRCSEEWDTARMCRLVNLGKSQFFAYYRKFFHNSPKAELMAARLDRAKNLLSNEAMPVQQAAALAGFRSLPYFTRYFKEACGCTPREYKG